MSTENDLPRREPGAGLTAEARAVLGPTKEVIRWGDAAMFHSEPLPPASRAPGGGVRPVVTLLNATPDPLGSLAAMYGIYSGRIVRALSELTDADRRAAWEDMDKTVLNGPLEAVQFQFLVEGVSRAFTHQAVRSRFSFFAQESLRFAVVDGEAWHDRSVYPPSLAAQPVSVEKVMGGHVMTPEERDYALQRDAWDDAILAAQNAYDRLVAAGVPAEDARGIMPHAIATRYHWIVDLRTLLTEAGKRLCTQAQFEWRLVMAAIAQALRDCATYRPNGTYPSMHPVFKKTFPHHDGWQFELIADALRPVCYQEGRCGFMAKFDRNCTIRERVNANAALGRPSSDWVERYVAPMQENGMLQGMEDIPAIRPEEWLADPNAAR